MSSPKGQRGLAGAAILVVMILALLAIVLGRSVFQKDELGLDQREATQANLRKISDALLAYATLNRRLPCPARGDLDTGDANPANATNACTTPGGVVPWKTLALRREHAIDGWGRKISYRVFDGASGFTQADSVSMTNCNTALGAAIDPALASGSLCKSGTPPPNTPGQYFGARGNMIVVNDGGVARNGNAFALISHGETGYGAFQSDAAGARASMPDNAGLEFTNTQAGGTYWMAAKSAPGVPPSAPAHFDDVVSYVQAADLIARAKLGARAWSDPLSALFNQPNLIAAGASFPTAEDTGVHSLGVGGFLVSASAAGASQNIGYRVDNSIGGIGVIGGSSTRGDLSSAFDERLTFQLGTESPYAKMDVALNAFQIRNFSPLQKERATLSFWRAGEPIQTTTVDSWDDTDSPTRCLFRLGAGRVFDRMDVAPAAQSGGGGSSRFTVASIKACTDATSPCLTTVSGAVGCPIPPASAASVSVSSVGTSQAVLNGIVEDNGVGKGTGSGYFTTNAGFPLGARVIALNSGSGTILAGNCVTFAGDSNVYPVAGGINAPGNLTLAAPGLLQAIPSSAKAVTVTHCQTSVSFDWGSTCGYGSTVAASPATVNAGSGSTAASVLVTGLSCDTTYYFRSRATGPGGTTIGNDKAFRTFNSFCPKPTAAASAPANVTAVSATMNGTVDDNGLAVSSIEFEHGTTGCYGASLAATPASIGPGAGTTAVSAVLDLTGVACNTPYHYRIRATSTAGTTTSDDRTFLTAPCP